MDDSIVKKISWAIYQGVDVQIKLKGGAFFGKLPKDNVEFETEGAVYITLVKSPENPLEFRRIKLSSIVNIQEVKLVGIPTEK